MSFAGSFQAIAARYGPTVTLWRDGEIVGTGRAVLRPLLGEARQFVPTDLGLRRQEMVLCLAEASLPLEEQPGNWVLQQGERFYGVRNVSTVEAVSYTHLQRYERTFQGAFYRRFVLGEWTAAEGLVYDFFEESMVRPAPAEPADRWVISCDYGTVNPTSMGLWGKWGGVWYRVQEYYYDARAARRQQTDQEYAQRVRELAGGREIEAVVVDPSAASFLEVLRREGWHVRKADNEVLSGIRRTAELLRAGQLVICTPCEDAIREFGLYRCCLLYTSRCV